MSKQVEVTKEMADVLDKIPFYGGETKCLVPGHRFFEYFGVVMKNTQSDVFTFLKQQNVTLEDLENIYKYGYKRKYEFKAGDIVGTSPYTFYTVVEDDYELYDPRLHVRVSTLNKVTHLKLTCKAENREDTKQ